MDAVFEFSSGTTVRTSETSVAVERMGGKAAAKALFAGRTMGKMTIKRSAITGVIFNADYLLICASGLPSPSDFKIGNIAEVKQYPNCVVAKESELQPLYEALTSGF